MCWINSKLEILTAETNIYVWKLIRMNNNKYYSIYQEFEYKLGVTYQTQMDIQLGLVGNFHCYEGFHSYDERVRIKYDDTGRILILNVDTGSILDIFQPNLEEYKIMECIIPKGSKYIVNRIHECVSECIKPIDVYDIEKTSELSKYLI